LTCRCICECRKPFKMDKLIYPCFIQFSKEIPTMSIIWVSFPTMSFIWNQRVPALYLHLVGGLRWVKVLLEIFVCKCFAILWIKTVIIWHLTSGILTQTLGLDCTRNTCSTYMCHNALLPYGRQVVVHKLKLLKCNFGWLQGLQSGFVAKMQHLAHGSKSKVWMVKMFQQHWGCQENLLIKSFQMSPH